MFEGQSRWMNAKTAGSSCEGTAAALIAAPLTVVGQPAVEFCVALPRLLLMDGMGSLRAGACFWGWLSGSGGCYKDLNLVG